MLVAANRNGYNSPEVPEKGYEAFQTYICDAIDIHQSLDDPSNIKFDITGIPIASSIKVYVMYNSGDSTIAIEEVPHPNKVEWWWDGTGWLYDSMSPQVGYIEMDSFRTRGAELGADNVNVFVTYSIWQQPAE